MTQEMPDKQGWYCAHCQRGVRPCEVTFEETHTECGRCITDDVPPSPATVAVPRWVIEAIVYGDRSMVDPVSLLQPYTKGER